MSSRKALRVAPARDGVCAASIWRFWRQGDEFYAAARGVAHASKLSFHRGGNWQLRVGTATQRFISTRHYAPGWLHVVSVQWLIFPGSLRPRTSGEEDLILVDTPEDSKLVVNLFVSVGKTRADPEMPPEGGLFLWHQQLRDGRRISVHAVTLLHTEQDRRAASGMLREAPEFTVDQEPDPSSVYAELAVFMVRPELGNIVAVLPLGPGVFRLREVAGA